MKNSYALLLSALLISAAPSASSQQARWSWARRDGNVTYSINPSYPRQIVAANSSRVLWGTIQNQRLTYTTLLGDYNIQEMDADGNQTGAATISGKLALLQARSDAAGNWYILGTLYDSMQVNGGGHVTRDPAGPTSDRFLLRLHAGTLAQDWLTPVGDDAFCATEGFILDATGIYLSVDSALSSHISHFDLSTGARTTIITQHTRSFVTGISQDASGGKYVLGNCLFTPMVDFNGTKAAVPALLQYPWYIVRYNADGTHDWHYFLNDITCNERALTASPDGVYLSGDLFDSTALGSHHFSHNSDPDYLLARLDSNGSVSWAHQRPITGITQGSVSFSGNGKAVAADSLLILAPESRGPAVWGAGGIATNNPSMNGTVVAYGSFDGNAAWAKNIDADYSIIQHAATDGSSVYITGVASDLSALGFDSVSVSTTAVPGRYVPYIAKLNFRQPGLKAEETSLAYGLYAWPNPATKSINLYTSDRGPIRIIDMQGRAMWRTAPDHNGTAAIDVAGWPRGMYVIQQPSLGGGGVVKVVLR